MIRTPAQHQTDPAKAPGQRSITPAITLADQIARHQSHDKPKLTFSEWCDKEFGPSDGQYSQEERFASYHKAWLASRENL